MSQKPHLNKPKLALTELCVQLMVSQKLQDDPQMILMLLLKLRVYQNVIHEDCYKLIQIGLKYPMHEVHECCWGIRQPEGNHRELKVPISRPERCLRDICLPNPHLMVTNAKVYLEVDSRSSQLIKQVINPRQWVLILDRNPVQLSIVNAQSKGPVFLLCKQNRSAPC